MCSYASVTSISSALITAEKRVEMPFALRAAFHKRCRPAGRESEDIMPVNVDAGPVTDRHAIGEVVNPLLLGWSDLETYHVRSAPQINWL